jgi:hypothetical protein
VEALRALLVSYRAYPTPTGDAVFRVILSYSKVVLLYYTKFYKISNLRREAVGRLVYTSTHTVPGYCNVMYDEKLYCRFSEGRVCTFYRVKGTGYSVTQHSRPAQNEIFGDDSKHAFHVMVILEYVSDKRRGTHPSPLRRRLFLSVLLEFPKVAW